MSFIRTMKDKKQWEHKKNVLHKDDEGQKTVGKHRSSLLDKTAIDLRV
jgi:hypothetical protein